LRSRSSLPRGISFDGLKIVIDCANGAAYAVAPKVLWELGAEVIELGTNPNGFNINVRCGSTAPEAMCAAVLEHGADLGIAVDGDADRIVLADRADRRRSDAGPAGAELADPRSPLRRRRGRHDHVEPPPGALSRRPRAAPAPHPGGRPLRRRAAVTISAASSPAT